MVRLTTTVKVLDEAIRIAAKVEEVNSFLELGRLREDHNDLCETINSALETGYFSGTARDELKMAQELTGPVMERKLQEAHVRIGKIRWGLLAPYVQKGWGEQ